MTRTEHLSVITAAQHEHHRITRMACWQAALKMKVLSTQ
jgi:hypothetical protein